MTSSKPFYILSGFGIFNLYKSTERIFEQSLISQNKTLQKKKAFPKRFVL